MITNLVLISWLIHILDKLSIIVYTKVQKTTYAPHNARWFFIHMMSNLMITYTSFFDLKYCIQNPYNSLSNWSAYSLLSYQIAVMSHVYHVLMFYKKLSKTEWIHHILMVGFAAPLAFMYPTRAAGASLFFMSGATCFL